MTDRILNDAHNLKKLIREAEALADESTIAFTRLKQAMAMSTSLLRVHDELSKVAREKMAGDQNIPTETAELSFIDADASMTVKELAD